MQKKNIIISLIVSLIFLFYMIFDYVGYIRYLKLHLYSVESYTKRYTNLEKADKSRVIVCFKYNDSNFKNLKPFLNSILDSTVRVDDISICMPYKNIKNIPSDMKTVLSIVGSSLNKDNIDLQYSILKEPENNTKIIIVEPGFVYEKDFIERMVEESNSNPDKIILSKKGIVIKPEFFSFDDDAGMCLKNNNECFSSRDWLEKCNKKKKKINDGTLKQSSFLIV